MIYKHNIIQTCKTQTLSTKTLQKVWPREDKDHGNKRPVNTAHKDGSHFRNKHHLKLHSGNWRLGESRGKQPRHPKYWPAAQTGQGSPQPPLSFPEVLCCPSGWAGDRSSVGSHRWHQTHGMRAELRAQVRAVTLACAIRARGNTCSAFKLTRLLTSQSGRLFAVMFYAG